MIRSVLSGSLLGLALLAQPAAAQSRVANVPPGQRPPAGLCRVWIEGVPPGRQPGVTDCRTARSEASRRGGRVIYGDDASRPGNGKAKGHYKKDKKDKKNDQWYGRRDDDRDDDHDGDCDDDRRDDRAERRRDRRDDRDDRDRRDGNVCRDADRDGRCDATQRRTIPGTTYPRESTTQPARQRRQTVTERLDSLRRADDAAKARRTPR